MLCKFVFHTLAAHFLYSIWGWSLWVFWSQNLDVLLTSPSPDFPLSDQMKHFCSLHWDSSHLSRPRIAGQHKILSLMVKACLFHPAFAWSLNPPFPGSQGIDCLWSANQLCFILAGLLGQLMNPDLTLYHEALISIHLWKFNMRVGQEKTGEGRRDSLALQFQTSEMSRMPGPTPRPVPVILG